MLQVEQIKKIDGICTKSACTFKRLSLPNSSKSSMCLNNWCFIWNSHGHAALILISNSICWCQRQNILALFFLSNMLMVYCVMFNATSAENIIMLSKNKTGIVLANTFFYTIHNCRLDIIYGFFGTRNCNSKHSLMWWDVFIFSLPTNKILLSPYPYSFPYYPLSIPIVLPYYSSLHSLPNYQWCGVGSQ